MAKLRKNVPTSASGELPPPETWPAWLLTSAPGAWSEDPAVQVRQAAEAAAHRARWRAWFDEHRPDLVRQFRGRPYYGAALTACGREARRRLPEQLPTTTREDEDQ